MRLPKKPNFKFDLNRLLQDIKTGAFFKMAPVRFVLIGIFNTLHFYIWYNIFLKLGIAYPIAFSIGFVLSMVGSFFLNSRFTFRTKPTLQKFIRFPLTTLPNYIISQVGLLLLVEKVGLPKNISGLAASLIAIPVTYLVTKKILTGSPKAKYQDDRAILLDQVAIEKGRSMAWLTNKDIWGFLGLAVFTYLCHRYIFHSGTLYGDDHTDSTVQMIYFLPYLIKEVLIKGHFWGWSYGMGGDLFSEFSYYYTTSPIIWSLLPLFKTMPSGWFTLENSLNLKLFISMYKQFLLMSAMYVLIRYEKRSRLSAYAAAIVYGGGLFYMWNSNFFDFFTDAYLWVPLMVLGFRIWQKKRNFWLLIISAGLAAMNNYYFAYHTFIFFILFVLVMTTPLAKDKDRPLLGYVKEVGGVAWQGFAALALAMVAFLPAVFSFLRIDRFDTVNPVSLFYTASFYKNLPINLFFNNSTLGLPMLVILVLFLNYKATSALTNRKMILLAIGFGLYLLPFTGYFLNGMNYHSERWFYLLIFIFAYALADILDEMKKKHHFNILWLVVIALASTLVIILRWDLIKGFDDLDKYIAVLAFNFLGFLLIALRPSLRNYKHRGLLDFLVVATILGSLVGNNLAYAGDQELNMTTSKMAIERMKSPELSEVMNKVKPKDNEFYRTIFHDNKFENAPTYYGYYGISTFASMTDGHMHDWIKRILNLRHDIVYLSSFNNLDNRAYLEGLLGVKYIVTNRSAYTPLPMYEKVFSNAKYDLYKKKDTVGFDLWFEEEIPVESIYTMIQPDMDLNLLHYAVTEQDNGLPKGQAKKSEEIVLDEEVMEFNDVSYDGQTIEFMDKGDVTFHIPDPYADSQVYLHSYVRPQDKKEFDQNLNSKHIFKSYETNPYVYYTNDWTWGMKGDEQSLVWTATAKKYDIKDLYLRRIDLRNFSQVIEDRNKYNLENLKIQGDKITGTIKNDDKGLLVLNIPYNKGWQVKDNGKPLTIQRSNGFLSAILLEPGNHKLEFTFRPRGFLPGFIISFLTLAGLIYFSWYRRKIGLGKQEAQPDLFQPILREEEIQKALYPRAYAARLANPNQGFLRFRPKRARKKKKLRISFLAEKDNPAQDQPLQEQSLPNEKEE